MADHVKIAVVPPEASPLLSPLAVLGGGGVGRWGGSGPRPVALQTARRPPRPALEIKVKQDEATGELA